MIALLAQFSTQSPTSLGVVALFGYVVIKEGFSFARSRNGHSVESKLDRQEQLLMDIRDGVKELVTLQRKDQ